MGATENCCTALGNSCPRVLNKLATGVDDGGDGGTTSCVGGNLSDKSSVQLVPSISSRAAAQEKRKKKFIFQQRASVENDPLKHLHGDDTTE